MLTGKEELEEKTLKLLIRAGVVSVGHFQAGKLHTCFRLGEYPLRTLMNHPFILESLAEKISEIMGRQENIDHVVAISDLELVLANRVSFWLSQKATAEKQAALARTGLVRVTEMPADLGRIRKDQIVPITAEEIEVGAVSMELDSANKAGSNFSLQKIRGKNVLLVFGILTNLNDLKRAAAILIRYHEAKVLCAAVCAFDIPKFPEDQIFTLLNLPVDKARQEECRLCRDGAPVD